MEHMAAIFDAGVQQSQGLHGDVRDSVVNSFDDGPEAVFSRAGLSSGHFVANL